MTWIYPKSLIDQWNQHSSYLWSQIDCPDFTLVTSWRLRSSAWWWAPLANDFLRRSAQVFSWTHLCQSCQTYQYRVSPRRCRSLRLWYRRPSSSRALSWILFSRERRSCHHRTRWRLTPERSLPWVALERFLRTQSFQTWIQDQKLQVSSSKSHTPPKSTL